MTSWHQIARVVLLTVLFPAVCAGHGGSDSLASPGNGELVLPPVGDDFQINTYTPSAQFLAAVAAGPSGRFVVVWNSRGSSDSDTDSFSIQGQRFASDGTGLGGEFQVNTYTTHYQLFPEAAVGPNGDFVVVWASVGSSGSDNSSYSIQGQRFASDGTAAGSEFQINTYTSFDQKGPDVAVGPDGDFVVVWSSRASGGSDTSSYSIQGQRFASDGVASGGEFQINSYTTGFQGFPAVVVAPDGGFVVVWESDGSSGDDSSDESVQGQRFASDGTTVGGEFQVNTHTTFVQRVPDLAVGPDGDFMVTWMSRPSPGDGSGYGIRGRRFASDGSPVGEDFQINTYTTYNQRSAAVASDAQGGFVVVWSSLGSSGSDTDSFSIQGQCFASDGTAVGGEFQVNTYTSSYQSYPDVAIGPDGDFLVVWDSDGSSGNDSSQRSAQGRLFTSLIFADSFESGDAFAWSVVVP